jgi:hypothetical protein
MRQSEVRKAQLRGDFRQNRPEIGHPDCGANIVHECSNSPEFNAHRAFRTIT